MKKIVMFLVVLLVFVPYAHAFLTADVMVDARTDSIASPKNTGLIVNPGDYLAIIVDPNQLWSAGPSPRTSNANGLNAASIAVGGADWGLFAPGNGYAFCYGTLVGQIGQTGAYFAVGTSYNAAVTSSGELRLLFWDSYYPDNAGFVTAHVQVIPVPPH